VEPAIVVLEPRQHSGAEQRLHARDQLGGRLVLRLLELRLLPPDGALCLLDVEVAPVPRLAHVAQGPLLVELAGEEPGALGQPARLLGLGPALALRAAWRGA